MSDLTKEGLEVGRRRFVRKESVAWRSKCGLWALMLVVSVVVILPGDLHAQECPNDVSCNPIFGSLVIPSRSSDAANRVVHGEQTSPDRLFTDNVLGLSYNRSWDRFAGSRRDDITQPLTWLGLESYWNGNSELNLDMAPPNSDVFIRPFGFVAAYNGKFSSLSIGGSAYASGSAGVLLQGGTSPLGPLVTITDRLGGMASNNMLKMARQDGSASFAWRGGGVPRLNFGLQQSLDANAFGNFGVLKFGGEWDYGEPVIEFESVGTRAILLRSFPMSTDSLPRFILLGTGALEWGPGNGALDADLYRSAAGTMRTDGNLVVGGNLAVMGQKAALVSTSSYGQREVYAVESPGEWFEDFGSGKLAGSQAIVRLEPVFGETVSTDRDYHVFLTPSGRCGLYVAEKRSRFFRVRRLSGSRSCAFDYRIVAKRRGYENVRLAEIAGIPAAKAK